MSRFGPRGREERRAFRCVQAFGVAFVLGSLGGTLLVDRCPMELRAPETEAILGNARAMPRRPDVAAFGSSRFGGSVDPFRVSARLVEAGVREPLVLNASVAAGDPIAFDALLARLEAEGRAPRVAVVELSPESVARASRWLDGALLRFLTWRDVARLHPGDVVKARVVNDLAASRLIPFFRHRLELVAWLDRSTGLAPPAVAPGPAAPAGPAGAPPGPAHRQEQGQEQARDSVKLSHAARPWLAKWLRGYQPGGLPAEALRRFLVRARHAGTAVVLVGVPISSPARAAFTPEVETAYRRFVDEIAGEAGLPYVEWRALLADEDFIDSHHVAPSGAARFSDHLATRLVAPLLASLSTGETR